MKYLILLVLAFPVFAQTLDELIDYALKHGTVLKLAENQSELSRLQHKESKLSSYGQFNVIGDLTHYNVERTLAPLNPITIKSGAPVTVSKDIFSIGISYGVPLFTGFAQTAQVQMDQLSKKMSDIRLKLTKEQLIYNIRSLYLTILSLEEMHKAQGTYVKALKKLTNQIAYEVKIGKRAKIDLLKSKSDLKDATTLYDTFDSNIATTKAALSSLVGKSVNSVSSFTIDVKKPSYLPADIYDSIATLFKVKIEDMKLTKSEKMIKKSEALKYPQITLNSYIGKNYGQDITSDEWDNETLWQVGLGLKYDLYDFGKKNINIQKAKILKIEASLKREQILLDLKKDITKALELIKQNYIEHEGNAARLKLTQESQKIEEVRYENNAATLNDLLLAKAKNQLSLAKVIQSKYEYQKSVYYLNYLLEKGAKE